MIEVGVSKPKELFLYNQIINTIYENGEGLSIVSILGVLELAKRQIINNAEDDQDE